MSRNFIQCSLAFSFTLMAAAATKAQPVDCRPAGAGNNLYCEQHNFTWPDDPIPAGQGIIWGTPRWSYSGHAYAQDNTTCTENKTMPAPGFLDVGPGSTPTQVADTAPDCPEVKSDANSGLTLNAYTPGALPPIGTPGTPIVGQIKVWGKTVINQPPNLNPRGNAESTSALKVYAERRGLTQNTLLLNNSVKWMGNFNVRVNAHNAVVGLPFAQSKDPISFEAQDLVTGQLTTGTLLDVSVITRGTDGRAGTLNWSDGTLAVDAYDADISYDMTSPYTVQQGLLSLQIRNGLVTQSDDSGIWDGILPPLGSPGTFSVPLSDIHFDYTLGDFGGHDVDLAMTFGNSGAAEDSAVPEPSSIALLLLGSLGLYWRGRRPYR